ncbi:hypothetical protein [Candidatus Palauibacter sp.]|uniref:hypothetical protein n=1 Tax=Candidatus Palauibacter sp. TaxID=3101350 RepID=UPI003CC62A2A
MPATLVLATLTPAEYAGWRRHFDRYPTAGYLLSLLWFTVASAFSRANEQPPAGLVGEWLSHIRGSHKNEGGAQVEQAARIARVRMTAEAYRRSKERARA